MNIGYFRHNWITSHFWIIQFRLKSYSMVCSNNPSCGSQIWIIQFIVQSWYIFYDWFLIKLSWEIYRRTSYCLFNMIDPRLCDEIPCSSNNLKYLSSRGSQVIWCWGRGPPPSAIVVPAPSACCCTIAPSDSGLVRLVGKASTKGRPWSDSHLKRGISEIILSLEIFIYFYWETLLYTLYLDLSGTLKLLLV